LNQTAWTGPTINAENWREVVRSKIETFTFEQALDDLRPFLGPNEDIDLLTKNNLMRLLK